MKRIACTIEGVEMLICVSMGVSTYVRLIKTVEIGSGGWVPALELEYYFGWRSYINSQAQLTGSRVTH